MGCEQYMDDQDFVAAIRDGGTSMEKAMSCLYKHYRERALALGKKMVNPMSGQQDDIPDLLHDAFLIMVDKVRYGGYNDGSLLHFWVGIAKGLLRNKMKRDARMHLVDDTTLIDKRDRDSPEVQMLSEEKRQILDDILSQLGSRCKKVLMLWAGGYSMREIAQKAGLSSEAMARKTKYKCKNKLMDYIDETGINL